MEQLRWTLSILTTLYLEYLSISNKIFGHLKFPPRTLHSLSLFSYLLYLELSLYRTNFPIPWTIFSLCLEHLHVRISFPNSRINSNLNQNKNFDRKWNKNLFFVLSVVKTKMSVKRNLNTKTLKEKCDILSHIEKGITNKEAADQFGVPKNTISTWIKNKEKVFQALE